MAIASSWVDLSSPHGVALIAIAVISVSPIVAAAWTNVRKREAELDTIRDLAQQGFSADEIERLVRGSSQGE